MSDLLVVEFSSEKKADGVREVLLLMRREYRIAPADAVVAIQDPGGRLKLNQLFEPIEQGSISDFWAPLIGLLFVTPLATEDPGRDAFQRPLTGFGLGEEFVRQAARTLRSGNAALFLLIREMTTQKVLAGLRGAGAAVLRSPFDETKAEALRAALAGARAAWPPTPAGICRDALSNPER